MRMNMKRSRISKRVSWSPGANLCQVKLFSCEDCPAKVGMKYEDHLPPKASKMLHSSSMEADDLPPGFENGFAVNQSQMEVTHIPRIQWKCPLKIITSNTWQVASGEESEEVKLQKSREAGVLEAVFPWLSSIPPSPAVSLDVQNENYNDNCTPSVPIIPIEEEESEHTPYIPSPVNTATGSQPSEMLNFAKCNSSAQEPLSSALPALGKLHDLGADVVTAASAALAVMNTVSKNGSIIDTDLLVKILRDPKMIQKLIFKGLPVDTGCVSTNMVSQPMTLTNTVTQSDPLSFPAIPDMRSANGNLPDRIQTALNTVSDTGFNRSRPPSVPAFTPTPESSHQQLLRSLPNGNLSTIQNQVRCSAETVSVRPNTMLPINEARVKDIIYYKNLIRKHGGEKVETQESVFSRKRNQHNALEGFKLDQNIKRGELKPKNGMPCKYFKSTTGCRNGSNCPYQHDMQTRTLLEAHGAKRMRLGGEFRGEVIECMNHLL